MSGKAWAKSEEALLRRLYPRTQTREIAVQFGRSTKAIATRAKLLRVRKDRNYHHWTPAEDRILRYGTPNRPGRSGDGGKKRFVSFCGT